MPRGGEVHSLLSMEQRTRRRRWPWLVLALLLLTRWALLLFQSDWKVTDRLLGSAMLDLGLAAALMTDGDLAAAKVPARRAEAAAEGATGRTDGPLWWILGRTPLGPNLRVAQQLVVVTDAASGAVLEPSCARVGALTEARADLEALDAEVPPSVATAGRDMLDLTDTLGSALEAAVECP